MIELNKCLELTRDIKDLQEKLEELETIATSPKSQVITGMPHGSGELDTAFDRYLMKTEKITKQIESMQEQKNELFESFRVKARQNIYITEQEIYLMYLRFYEGLKWVECVNTLNEQCGKWNINKAFRIYRKILKYVR